MPRKERARGNGDNTAFKTPTGRWRAQGYVTDALGNRKRLSAYGATKREAEASLADKIAEAAAPEYVHPQRQTVAEYLAWWLETVVRRKRAPRTYESYEGAVRIHIAPLLGTTRLDALKPRDVETFLARLADAGRGERTQELAYRVLSAALNYAVDSEQLARNPARHVEAPRTHKAERPSLAVLEARRLLEAAREDPLEALYVLALTTGLRKGELLGLHWPDVDLPAYSLRVRQQAQRLPGEGIVEGRPKSKSGLRPIRLTDLGVLALRRQMARQEGQRTAAGDYWHEQGLVFTSEFGSHLDSRNLDRRSFKPLLQRAGLPDVPFHSLRHSTGGLLVSLGVPLPVIQRILGHSQITVTIDTYGHVAPELQDAAMLGMQALLSGEGEDDPTAPVQ